MLLANLTKCMITRSLEAGSVEGGDRLLRRTEYHCGAVITKTLTVARRRPNEDKSATQSQIALGKSRLWGVQVHEHH